MTNEFNSKPFSTNKKENKAKNKTHLHHRMNRKDIKGGIPFGAMSGASPIFENYGTLLDFEESTEHA